MTQKDWGTLGFMTAISGTYLAGIMVCVNVWGCAAVEKVIDTVEPIARNGGMVCLAVPDEDREVCAHAATIIQAAIEAEQRYEAERDAVLDAGEPSELACPLPEPAASTAAPAPAPVESAEPPTTQ